MWAIIRVHCIHYHHLALTHNCLRFTSVLLVAEQRFVGFDCLVFGGWLPVGIHASERGLWLPTCIGETANEEVNDNNKKDSEDNTRCHLLSCEVTSQCGWCIYSSVYPNITESKTTKYRMVFTVFLRNTPASYTRVPLRSVYMRYIRFGLGEYQHPSI